MKRSWILSALVMQALACSAGPPSDLRPPNSDLRFPTSGLRSPISDRLAIRAIIGEGSSQSDAALRGIASAIHNRGTLRGVYGLTNPVVDRATAALWARAARAWNLAKNGVDAAAGCKFFGCPTDAPYFHQHGFTPVKTIGQITFYRP